MANPPMVVDVLKRMKSLLRKGWTQRASARSEKGRPVGIGSPRAVAFCLVGARARALAELSAEQLYFPVTRLLVDCLPNSGGGMVAFNDTKGRKKAEVVKAVDCAIAKSLERG